jgi:hypothetical protein
MYTPSRHSFAPVACFVVEAEVVAGILQDLIFRLLGQVSVLISEVLNSGSAEENGPRAWRQ